MKPNILALLVSVISWTAVTSAQEQVVIEAFESSGQFQFSKVSNAVSYRVEWAPGAGGPWTNFSVGAAYLDEIISTGLGVATAYVPMVYRVIATVTNPPAPAGMSLIPAEAPDIAKAVDGYKKFMTLTKRQADLVVQDTRKALAEAKEEPEKDINKMI